MLNYRFCWLSLGQSNNLMLIILYAVKYFTLFICFLNVYNKNHVTVHGADLKSLQSNSSKKKYNSELN